MRQTRLYHKGSNQQTYQRFQTVRLASDPALLKRFVFPPVIRKPKADATSA